MESLLATYKVLREEAVAVQDALVRIHNDINENIIGHKRIDAELEEIDSLKDTNTTNIYKQCGRMFVKEDTASFRKIAVQKQKKLEESLVGLKNTEKRLQEHGASTKLKIEELEKSIMATA